MSPIIGLTVGDVEGARFDRVDRVEDRKGHDLRYSVDITKISNELGYTPQVDFKTGLAATVDWYRNNRAWWEPLKNAPSA
jgi:dTDP-glucose 4,6-dehydratase